MRKVLVSVYDKVAGIYSAPMTEPNFEVAQRNFKIGVRQNQMITVNPGDFELVVLAVFDDETGVVFPNTPFPPDTDALAVYEPRRIQVSDLIGIRSDSTES